MTKIIFKTEIDKTWDKQTGKNQCDAIASLIDATPSTTIDENFSYASGYYDFDGGLS